MVIRYNNYELILVAIVQSCIQFFEMLVCPIKLQIKVGIIIMIVSTLLSTYWIDYTQYDIMMLV